MHSIYFARHGETVWNVENKICGMTDSPLTEKGRQQARELGRKVKESGIHIDEILYSPLSRAADTAKAVAEATGLPARRRGSQRTGRPVASATAFAVSAARPRGEYNISSMWTPLSLTFRPSSRAC